MATKIPHPPTHTTIDDTLSYCITFIKRIINRDDLGLLFPVDDGTIVRPPLKDSAGRQYYLETTCKGHNCPFYKKSFDINTGQDIELCHKKRVASGYIELKLLTIQPPKWMNSTRYNIH
ncbi:hypothetical protein JW826_04025 [Candidatus Woesearchaeota archaeon]|nr:hypothetical protein [Candidatus Woesearchaeota archaeon]